MTTEDLYRLRVKRVYWLTMAVLLLAGMALVASLLSYKVVRQDSERTTALSESNNRILQRVEDQAAQINDCLDPAGTCAKRGRANSQNVSSAIVFCSLNLSEDAKRDEVTSCIVDALKSGK